VLIEAAKESTNRALKLIYSEKNLLNGKIRHNADNLCLEISTQTVRDMEFWMIAVYRHLNRFGQKTWTEIGKMVNEGIERTATYLEEQPSRYAYPPKYWLNTQFSGGTLFNYVETYIMERVEDPSVSDNRAALKATYTPQIAWMLENGANRDSLMHYVRKFGAQTVSEAVSFAGAKIAADVDFKPKNGAVPYIFGILKNLNPQLIGIKLEEIKVKIAQKKRDAEKTIYWTGQRIIDVLAEITAHPKMQYLRQYVTDTDIQAFAKKYSNRPASHEGQLKIELEDLVKSRRNFDAA
jgi:hypothetical protein